MKVYLEPSEYRDAYRDAQRHSRFYFEPFDEYERIANNKIRTDLPDNMPRVNDGSLAALMMETPMRVLAQMMSGTVKAERVLDPMTGQYIEAPGWLRELADIVWNKKIIPNANTQTDFFSKWQIALYRALKYGGQPIYDFYTTNGDYRGADMSLPYVRDVYLEDGKVSDLDSDYIFMDSYFTKLRIKKIIAHVEELMTQGIESPWNVDELKKVYDTAAPQEKDEENKSPQEKDKSVRNRGIKFTTIFQRGVKSPFCTFYEQGEGETGILKVRSWDNKNPEGDVPIHFLYGFQDLENPQGKGQVEVSGGIQNVLDHLVQSDVLSTQIGFQPPIKIAGNRTNTDLDSLIFAPNQFWFTGDAQVDLMRNDSPIYTQFPQRYGLYKTSMLSAQGTTTAEVSAESGNPMFSKTPKGIDQQQARTNAHDNYLRKQVFRTYNLVAKSMLNNHFANMQGSEALELTKTESERLMRAGLIDENPMTKEPSAQEIEMIWDNLRGVFDFETDPESSQVKDDLNQVEKLKAVADSIVQNPAVKLMVNQTGWDINMGEVYRQIFTKLGLQDIEKIIVQMTPQQGMLPGAIDPMTGQPMPGPAGPGMPGAPAQGTPQGNTMPPEIMVAINDVMDTYGIDEQSASAVLQAREMGVPEENIVNYLRTGKA